MRISLRLSTIKRLPATLPMALLAGGCGGGDIGRAVFTNQDPGTAITNPAPGDPAPFFGGESAGQNPQAGAPADATPITIGTDNAAQVAASVIGMVKAMLDVGAIGSAIAEAGNAAATGVLAAPSFPRAGLILAGRRGLGASAWPAPRAVIGAELIEGEGTPTYRCDNAPGDRAQATGGTFSLQDLAIRKSSYYLTGRTLVAHFDDCLLGAVHADGGLNIKDLSVADDPHTPATEIMSGQISFNGLSLLTDAGDVTMSNNSDSAMSYQVTLHDGVLETEIHTGFMTVARDETAGNNLHDLAIRATYDQTNEARTWSADGEITSLATNGTLAVATHQALEWLAGSDDPTGGILEISDPSNTSVKLTAYGNVTVRMETDSNGDGLADDQREIEWQELLRRGI